ncbi:galactosyl transferase GMA12/MNN10 family-domain-containing protein [Mucor mucedo]|uniref:galactosyl transferase GMA12/MNN10 family-domain-containing protein n=1 Tax=Mucor mucedo TaxID=29922 RepID=UPI00221F9A67|nr:galactosyl transferase GMA12/MNN10 family-domain-containing protein [Mucor mucedo]KAI7889089.1 galactosyl transferase GMA12/MNN10 family-domain-containing protein [Mucor mucedo]
MAGSELPFPNNARAENATIFGGSRFGRKKRTIFVLLLVAVFFVLWFNSDLDRLSNTVVDSGSAQSPKTTTVAPSVVIEDDEADLDEQPEPAPAVVTEKAPAKAVEDQKKKTKPSTLPILPDESTPQHFKYLMIIASRASNLSRRQLIRKTYFGMEDNLEPCMKKDKGFNYMFWVYGEKPMSKTPERRLYETEKIEWNDLEKVDQSAYSQDEVLKWAETTLKERGVTYDYLVIQDAYSLIQLNYIQQTIQSEVGQFPTGKLATDLAWVSPGNKNALVAGSTAVQKLLENESEYKDVITEGENTLMANFYEFHRSVSVQLNFVTAKKELSRLQALKENSPFFISETNRFATWKNHVESIADLTIAVSNIYQDSDFAAVAHTLNLGGSSVCKPLEKASIAVVTSSFIYDNCMEPSASLAADNKRSYALKHNYAFVARSGEFAQQQLREEKRRPVWGKIDVVQKVLPKYDWLFWMDMDAVIMNPEQTVQTLLDEFRNSFPEGPRAFEKTIDLVISKPTKDKMINAGVFFMRNTEWAQKFLNTLQESTYWYNKGPSYEQGAMWDLIQEPGYKEHVLLLENDDHTFNTFPKLYVPGDFIVHFAPDKCPNSAVLGGLKAARQIQQGQTVTSFQED